MPTTDKKIPRTGGPAFPRPASEFTLGGTLPDGNDPIPEQDGMSLRDYFAAHVLPAVYAASVARGDELQETIVAEAYELADAMLEERAK
jgi:hypothetical protein